MKPILNVNISVIISIFRISLYFQNHNCLISMFDNLNGLVGFKTELRKNQCKLREPMEQKHVETNPTLAHL